MKQITFRQALNIARKIFPESIYTKDFLGYAIWNETGWPGFFRGDVRTELTRQLKEYRAKGVSK